MGFMVKPFWVDAGFSASEIGLISVNVGLLLSVAGGVLGGLVTHRLGVFTALWSLGLLQALSNLGYVYVAHLEQAGRYRRRRCTGPAWPSRSPAVSGRARFWRF